ncbi:ECF transporter S component [Mycoplasma testudineum]|uniref:ECF transporter S component n=1 Tax=Mycoplasma testudineum TaxID=244584 RepID=UPI00141526F2|nr:ECF transporter S component [Mycoplasma testudineum]
MAILISISITLAIIGATIIPIASIPSYKLSFTGLPVKISGFIFGPVIGFFIGVVADLLSFLFLPSFFHWGYVLISGVNGIVPGLVGIFFFKIINNLVDRRQKIISQKKVINELEFEKTIEFDNPSRLKNIEKSLRQKRISLEKLESKKSTKVLSENQLAKKLTWIYFFSGLLLLMITGSLNLVVIFTVLSREAIEDSFVKSPEILAAITSVGVVTISLYLFFARFKLDPKKYYVIVAIVSFSIILEATQVYFLAYTDNSALKIDFLPSLVQHVIFAPVKIWFNMTIIYFSWRVINYLLHRNQNISL